MIKVKEHGPAYRVKNPARRGESTTMVNVVLKKKVEQGQMPTLERPQTF